MPVKRRGDNATQKWGNSTVLSCYKGTKGRPGINNRKETREVGLKKKGIRMLGGGKCAGKRGSSPFLSLDRTKGVAKTDYISVKK